MKKTQKSLDILDQILYFCFDNIYLKYKEGICFNSQKVNEKTDYRLKNYFKIFEKLLEETSDLETIFREIKQKAIFLEKKKKEVYKTDDDFFFKIKYIFFYNLIISHYIFLLKEINNKKINEVAFDFEKIEKSFVKEYKIVVDVYSEIGKQMYPEIAYVEKPVNKFKKKNKNKNKTNLYKSCYYFFFFLLICIFIMYFCVFSLKLFDLLFCFFFFIFKHKKMSEEEFYQNYQKNLQDMSLSENIDLYSTDLYNFFFADFVSPKISFLCLFIVIFLLHHIFKSKFFNSNKMTKTFRDTCLRSNLLDYHRIIYSFSYICGTEKSFFNEQMIQTKRNKKINLYNLYYILNNKEKNELSEIIIEYKKYIEYNLKENEKSFIKIVYIKELQHCNLILKILEEKSDKGRIPYDIESFEKKMSIKIEHYVS